MKAFVASSMATFLCLLALVRSAPAQGNGYFCSGPFEICLTPCVPASGTCPDVPDDIYVASSEALANMTTTCAEGMGSCSFTQQVTACYIDYYLVRNYLGQCSNTCGNDDLVAYVCQLQ